MYSKKDDKILRAIELEIRYFERELEDEHTKDSLKIIHNYVQSISNIIYDIMECGAFERVGKQRCREMMGRCEDIIEKCDGVGG